MKGLIAIIEALTPREKKEFLLRQRRMNRRTDAKNEKLFSLIDAGKTKNLDLELYGKPSRNSFHALCKRLQDNLIDFVASKSFAGETSEELEILKLLLASRIFFEKRHYKIAFKTLENAEKMAIPLELHSILNEVYHTKIQYSHLNDKWVIEDVIKASEMNMKSYLHDFRLNRAYAIIKSRMRQINEGSVQEIVQDTFSQLDIEINEALTYKSLFQLMEIAATAAKLQRDFYSVSPFMLKLYMFVRRKNTLKDRHRYYHLNILNLLAITHFRNKDFETSMDFINEMEIEMHKQDKTYYKRFKNKWVTLKALNYNYTGENGKAISLLKKVKHHSLDIDLLLAMCLFQQGSFSQAYQIVKNMNHSDNWYEKKMDWVWVVKKNLIEILLLIELDKLDLVLLRLQQFKRKFSKRLQENNEERVLTFTKLVSRYYENPEYATTQQFNDEVENSFEWLGREQEDIFVMSFYAWLKAKIENENLYEVTLKLVDFKSNS